MRVRSGRPLDVGEQEEYFLVILALYWCKLREVYTAADAAFVG